MSRLSVGKIPIALLDSTVLCLTGAGSKMVVTPAKAGLDFAAIKVGEGYMIVSADPITGVVDEIGKYAVFVSANDVATSGNRPQFAETVVLLPQGSLAVDVEILAKQIDKAAKEIGVTIVGGHTEVTPGLRKPIVMATVFGFVKKYISSGDAQDGDTIMMTKTAGLEGTAAISRELGIPKGIASQAVTRRARRFLGSISVVDEAVAAFGTGQVSAMHDCTEGGVLGAVYEMSIASGLGFELKESAVPVAPETNILCSKLTLDPLKLIGSGSLLISVRSGKEEIVRNALKQVCKATVIGHFTSRERVLMKADGSESRISSAPEDELWRALSGRR